MSFQFEHYVEQQRRFFYSGATQTLAYRRDALRKLRTVIESHEEDLFSALHSDLGKPRLEALTAELGMVYREIGSLIKNLKRWSRTRRVAVDLFLQPAQGLILREPYGVCLIIGPWNYPFQLLLAPLAAAVAAGNTVIAKPSEVASSTAEVVARIIQESFEPEHVMVIQGGIPETSALFDLPFDKIFFTGSVPVGKLVMAAAARRLTPLTLELGGKSPAIVDRSANLETAARKIVWGKFSNAGQTCVAPDFLLVERSVAEKLLSAVKKVLHEFYGEDPALSPHYGRIINQRNLERLSALLADAEVWHGGQSLPEKRYLAPTILYPARPDQAAMTDEIFGPILPVLVWDDIEEAIVLVRSYGKPLALYLFTTDRNLESRIMRALSFGGGGVNCTILHVAAESLPFGGVGPSGLGRYHGQAGFDEFSNLKSVLRQPAAFKFGVFNPARQPPEKLLRTLMG